LTQANLIGKSKALSGMVSKREIMGERSTPTITRQFCNQPVKIQVLDDLESELKSQLKSLDRRNVDLARTLGIKRHRLT
jgi:hypothetical protein